MDTREFEEMLVKADLHPFRSSASYGVAFSVSLHVPTEIPRLDGGIVRSLRIQCDWLTYQPAEFAMMSLETARRDIALCIARLQRAAKTKQGTLPKARATA